MTGEQEFAAVDVLRLEVQEGWPDLPNDVLNPNGEGGAWGWFVSDEDTVPGTDPGESDYVAMEASAGGEWLQFRVKQDLAAYGGGCYWLTEIPPAVAGLQIRALFDVLTVIDSPASTGLGIQFEDDDGISTGAVELAAGFPGPITTGVHTIGPVDIPVGTTRILLAYICAAPADDTHRVRFRDVWQVHGPTADVVASDPLTDPPWVDVLGSAASISVERDELNVGVLEATLYDATLDPASTDLIRPGKRCRLEALVDGTWERLFTGKLDNPSSAYEIRDPLRSDLRRVQIKLVASDAAADLANEPRAEGVATLAELPYVLLGTEVPFNVNGSDDSIAPGSVVVVAVNDQASALDQIAVTRDSVLGYSWVDRNGVLQAWDRDLIWRRPLELANGDFDVDVSGWTGTNATLTQGTTTESGAGALRLTADGAGTASGRTPTGDQGIRVVEGSTYRLEAYSRRAVASASRSTRLQLRWYDEAGAFLSATSGTSIANTTTFVLREVEGAAPAGAHYLTISLDVLAPAATEQHSFDSLSFWGESPARLDEQEYSDAGVDFDVDRTFNSLRVEVLRVNPGTGETETVEYGPYVDEAARREWRAREATFKVQGVDESLIDDYAAEILELNAQPVKRVNTVTLPIRDLDELESWALLDLYDLVSISSDRADVDDQLSRITTVKHRIIIKRENRRLTNRWFVDLAFSTDGSVAPPQVTPAPSPGGGRTLSELLRPIGEVTMWFGHSAAGYVPAGWLICDGSAFDPDTYPALAQHWDDAGLVGYVLPDFTDRFPIGAGSKLWSSSGGNATKALTTANLPAHTHSILRKAGAGTSGGVVRGNGVAETDGVTGDGGFGATPVDIMNPWRAVWFIIRAA